MNRVLECREFVNDFIFIYVWVGFRWSLLVLHFKNQCFIFCCRMCPFCRCLVPTSCGDVCFTCVYYKVHRCVRAFRLHCGWILKFDEFRPWFTRKFHRLQGFPFGRIDAFFLLFTFLPFWAFKYYSNQIHNFIKLIFLLFTHRIIDFIFSCFISPNFSFFYQCYNFKF